MRYKLAFNIHIAAMYLGYAISKGQLPPSLQSSVSGEAEDRDERRAERSGGRTREENNKWIRARGFSTAFDRLASAILERSWVDAHQMKALSMTISNLVSD